MRTPLPYKKEYLGWRFYSVPGFICNILKGDLHIDVLIKELFQICIFVIQTLGEGTLVEMSLLMCEGQLEELVQHGCRQGLLCMILCYSCHINGIGTSRSKKAWDALKSSVRVEMQAAVCRGYFSNAIPYLCC